MNAYNWDWSILIAPETLKSLGLGIETTLLVSLISLVIGTTLGFLIAAARIARIPVLGQIIYVYVELFRTTPALVQLIWIFYVLPLILGVHLTPMVAGVIALSLNSSAFLSEVFRGGLASIDRGQHDASFVLGLTTWQKYTAVLIPQTVRRVLPSVTNQFVALLKESSLLSVIAVTDLTYLFQVQVADTYRPLELYSGLAIAYFCVTYPLILVVRYIERRFPIL
ncbi:MAG TPA: amino acid ABC transporter permease [Lacisediminihabitans sp.]|uniref:amino acid ABC transporter permease n=1 Tax=Lacisediminihabitans sp. TaxID=2787631 RepID=UPI002EDA8C61